MLRIGISGDAAFRRLCQALENQQWAEDARFRTNPDRVRNTPELDALINGILARRPITYWTEVFDRHDVASDPLQNAEQILHDRQAAALRQFEQVNLSGAEPAWLPRLPLGLSANPPAIQGPPPEPGADTLAVLRESGFAESEIEALLSAGICGGSGKERREESEVA